MYRPYTLKFLPIRKTKTNKTNLTKISFWGQKNIFLSPSTCLIDYNILLNYLFYNHHLGKQIARRFLSWLALKDIFQSWWLIVYFN